MSANADDVPRSFREVAIMIRNLKEDIQELQASIDRIQNLLLGALACPLFVGLILGIVFKA